jgi:ADP-ribose pyrophosphatase YjhB (NUDIX family)
MELGETPEEGAAREAREEANADVRISSLLAVYTVPRISIVQVFYRSVLERPEFSCGRESLEVKLFPKAEIPWTQLAFPTVNWALYHHLVADHSSLQDAVYGNPHHSEGGTDVWFDPADGKLNSVPFHKPGD